MMNELYIFLNLFEKPKSIITLLRRMKYTFLMQVGFDEVQEIYANWKT